MRYPILLLSLSLILIGCGQKSPDLETADAKPLVYTVNYPLAYFAERIAGDAIELVFPEIEGDPAFWEPSPDDLIGFQEADLILINGATYAKWLGMASLSPAKFVNTSIGFRNEFIEIPDAMTHSHGDGTVHSHGATAFTTWLDPLLAIQQAVAIDHALTFENSGFSSLKNDLIELDKSFEAAFSELKKENLIGSHPVYQYLERRYGLKMQSVHWEPDTVPTEEMWDELYELLETHPSTYMLWEDEPLAEVRESLSKKGIQSIVFNPAGNRPEAGDYLSIMRQNIENLRSATIE